ncbi:hypothetical protein PILCRDRAFT_744064 [Piloderma croceum F 1598]|uniref:Uncharacterized protein n=1 Tax=Piloderma croceum (strain F 1598) TaxID=765440 RepID=A0A0C3B4J7_PILCF|nr:hypothetical protein PILCRDRAFT_744064 [Piloderma croceum F 1598]
MATERIGHNDFVALTVVSNTLTLKRVDLKKERINISAHPYVKYYTLHYRIADRKSLKMTRSSSFWVLLDLGKAFSSNTLSVDTVTSSAMGCNLA